MKAFRSAGSEPNANVVAALCKASETYTIVASQDIVDMRGLKLWAQGQAVSTALQQRLLDRKLKKPLEACLEAQDGVTSFTLLENLQRFIETDEALATAVRPWSSMLLDQVKRIPLHSVVQLLLTAILATRPNALHHAVAGMALVGAMMARRNASVHDVRIGMLGGLLHDIGEVYIPQQYLDYSQALDLTGHKHLVVHPRVGQVLLTSLTDYPQLLSRAVGEHHERLDRSGYPARLSDEAISTLGRVLAVMEVALGVSRLPTAPLTRASFALRVVPGEFDMQWASFVCDAARNANEEIPAGSEAGQKVLLEQLAEIDRQMAQAHQLAVELIEQGRTSKITDVVGGALQRLERLRLAWNALGLWAESAVDAPAAERFELELARIELDQRMRSFQRECLLLSDGLGEAEKIRLSPLWMGILSESS